ncbi:DUF6056 family protein [Streptomyces xiangluensis]|uniref:DUF6056 family protein n=1 Tax=Streptomyces xiangluensis TaxID=2665720 RepID=A0ABV8Z0V5_9ACTN
MSVGGALLLLAAASLLGLEVRLSGDEWCFLPQVRDEGVGAVVHTFYAHQNGRIFNGMIVEAFSVLDVHGLQLFPAVSAMVTVTVLWGLARQVWRVMGLEGPRGLRLLAAVTVTVLFLLGSANTYHTFYWAGANESHTMPPVLACAALWSALAARSSRQRTMASTGAALLGVCIALWSEETTVVCAAVLAGVLLCGRWLFAARVRAYAAKWALCGLGGLVVGMAVLMTSPGLHKRRLSYAPSSPLAPESLWQAFDYWTMTLAQILTTWQYVAALALGVLIGLHAVGGRPVAFASVRLRFLVPLSAAVFLACGYAATVVVMPLGHAIPHVPRLRNDYLLLLILLFVVYGALLGRVIRARLNPGRTGWTAGVVAVCALAVWGVAIVSLVPPLYGLGKEMRVRAAQWDRQNEWLHRQAADGATTLPYKPLPIQGLAEPFQLARPRPTDWVARCAARYYRVDAISRSSVLP